MATEDEIRFGIFIDLASAAEQINKFMSGLTNVADKIQFITTLAAQLARNYGVAFDVAKDALFEFDKAMRNFSGGQLSLVGGSPKNAEILAENVTKYANALGGLDGHMKESASAGQQLGDVIALLSSRFGGFGGMGGTVANMLRGALTPSFGLLSIAVTALITEFRFLTNFFKEAIGYADEYAEALYKINAASNLWAMQGTPFPVADMKALAAEMQKGLPFFSKEEAINAVGNLTILTRNLHMTTDQTTELTKAIAAASVVMGKPFEEAGRMAAIAISSGWSEGLQRMGFNINKAVIANRAAEMGFKRTAGAFSQEATAAATLSLVLEQGDAIWAQAIKKQDTAIGQIDMATAKMRQAKQEWGLFLLPLKGIGAELTTFLANSMQGWMEFANFLLKTFLGDLAGIVAVTTSVLKGNFTGLRETFRKAFYSTTQAIEDYYDQMIALDAVTSDATEGAKEYSEEQLDLANALKIAEQYAKRMAETQRDYNTELERAREDYKTGAIRDMEDFNKKIVENNQKMLDDQAKAAKKYRDDELMAELRFQEQMRELRENTMLSLEEAVRLRDARQVIRILKEYKLNKEAAERQYALDKLERARRYADEQADRKKEARDRLKELNNEYNTKARREMEDYDLKEARRKEDFLREMAELSAEWKQKLDEWTMEKSAELELNAGAAEEMRKLINSYYGPGGVYEGLYNYSYASLLAVSSATISQINANIAAVMTSIAATMNMISIPETRPNRRRAAGGLDVASSPTTVTFGEAGKELALFIPFDKLNSMKSSMSLNELTAGAARQRTPMSGGSSLAPSMAGIIELLVTLSPELEARIVNDTSDYVASRIQTIRGEQMKR
jgi:hypothetical protein